MLNGSKLISKNIYIRQLDEISATEDYLLWLNDPDINKYLEVRHFPPKTINDLKKSILKIEKDPYAIIFGIYLTNNKFIGTLKLHSINSYHNFAYIGIMIGDKQSHGKGYGLEALSLLIEYSKRLNIKYLYAGCYGSNIASFKCFLKAGFVKVS